MGLVVAFILSHKSEATVPAMIAVSHTFFFFVVVNAR